MEPVAHIRDDFGGLAAVGAPRRITVTTAASMPPRPTPRALPPAAKGEEEPPDVSRSLAQLFGA